MIARFRESLPQAVFVLVAALLATGCGDSRRNNVAGNVTVNGEPLEAGYIQFLPLENTASPTAGAEIHQGRYEIPATGGPFTGEFRVEITASRNTGRTTRDPDSGEVVNVTEQYLPHHYNQQSELRARIESGSPDSVDFNLELQKAIPQGGPA